MKFDQKLLYKAIDEILWNDWDPIGINDNGPRDEYNGCIPPIFDLILEDAEIEVIAQKLDEIATNSMGLDSNLNYCREIAIKLKNLRNL